MGIAEIQAALAQGAHASANPFAAPAAPQAPAFQPSPFGAPQTAAPNPFGGSAPAPAFQPPPAATQLAVNGGPFAPAQPAQAAFAFNPPPGFNPATTPPINPPGERASLNSPAPEPAPAAPAVEAPAPAEPKRRTRKPKADGPAMLAALADVHVADAAPAPEALQSPAEVVLGSISTEDLVAVLRERGYSVWLEAKS